MVSLVRQDIKVDVLGVAPAPCIRSEREASAEHKGQACVARNRDGIPLNLPLVIRDKIHPWLRAGIVRQMRLGRIRLLHL